MKNGMIYLYFRTPIGRLAPIGEITPGCDKKHNVETFKYRSHAGANLRMITVVQSEVDPFIRSSIRYLGPYRLYTVTLASAALLITQLLLLLA